MTALDRFSALLSAPTEAEWCSHLFSCARELGFEQTLFALVPPNTPLADAFLRSCYAPEWRQVYDEQGMAQIDPTVAHCLRHRSPLIWSPEVFVGKQQKQLYEEACAYGLRAGVTMPIHGPQGEVGIVCFVSDGAPGKAFFKEVGHQLGTLSLLRDIAHDSSVRFTAAATDLAAPSLTPREIECMKWAAAGKSSWDIAQILNCSTSTVNFHFTNVRQKFGVSTLRQALVKAIRLGILAPY